MAMKKACCCLSTRVGILVFLYMYLIGNIWTMLSLLTPDITVSMEEFLKDDPFLYYTLIFIGTVGSLIYLATIISLTNNTPSKDLLYASAAILLLSLIHEIYATFLFSGDDMEAVFDVEIEKEVKKLSSTSDPDTLRMVAKGVYRFQLRVYQFSTAISALIIIYAFLVIYAYVTKIETNQSVGSSDGRIISEGGNSGSSTVRYLAQPPQYPPVPQAQPPQYPSLVSQGFAMPSKM